MRSQLDPTKIKNLQSIESAVSGPDGANRLFTIMGAMPVEVSVSGGVEISPEFSLHVGPTLTRRQFHRASGSAFPCSFGLKFSGGGAVSTQWSIESVDADWDDEAQRVQLLFEVHLKTSGNVQINVADVGFQVTILAEVTDT